MFLLRGGWRRGFLRPHRLVAVVFARACQQRRGLRASCGHLRAASPADPGPACSSGGAAFLGPPQERSPRTSLEGTG
eukprot:1058440-Alexandrium_andersonii.AAC.1